MEQDIMASAPAVLGSLSRLSIEILNLVQLFEDRRDARIGELLGVPHRNTRLREAMLRTVVISYGADHPLSVTQLEVRLREFGGRGITRLDLDLLVSLGLLARVINDRDRRVVEVWPTRRLVAFYNARLPELATDTCVALSKLEIGPNNDITSEIRT